MCTHTYTQRDGQTFPYNWIWKNILSRVLYMIELDLVLHLLIIDSIKNVLETQYWKYDISIY